ncbi:hypothetical protein DFJ74DRAFT_702764 [Hyaloraphidium curvatum]|nr:hypothetical protein DFJ74DRAFT_702764 [Hyaloraphidium curvatum]
MPGVLSTLVGAPDPRLQQVVKFTGTTGGIGSFILFFTFLTQAVSNSSLASAAPDLVKKMAALLAVLSDVGYTLRLPGSLGVINSWKALEANTEVTDSTILNLTRLELASNLVYYVSENLAFLGGKGVLNLDAAAIGRHGLRAGQATLVNLLTTLVRLYLERKKLQTQGAGDEKDRSAQAVKARINTMSIIATAALVPVVLGAVRPDLKVLDGFQSGLAGMITGYISLRGQWAAAAAK